MHHQGRRCREELAYSWPWETVVAGALITAAPALADHEIERVEGPEWTRFGGPGEIKIERAGDRSFVATITGSVPNECFTGGKKVYDFKGHEPEYLGREFFAVVDGDPGPGESLYEAGVGREIPAGDTCTGMFTPYGAEFLISTIGPQLQFGGGAVAGPSTVPVVWRRDRVDPDGDGLYDDEELSGINIPYDPQTREISPETEVDLRRMGADPQHKDLFVEVDQMRGHEMSPDAVLQAERIFAEAPVSNPDGRRGISLHIDAGPATTMDFETGRSWGELSESDTLPHDDVLGPRNVVPEEVFTDPEYLDIKATYFDNCPSSGILCHSARSLAFRYMISIHRLAEAGAGGLSGGVPAVEAILAFQCPRVDTECNLDPDMQAGLFTHEFGHALGLHHGGPPDDFIVRKPNHFSAMNFSYGMGVPTTRGPVLPGYSEVNSSQVPDLVERSLDERQGVQASSLGSRLGESGGEVLSIFHCRRSGRRRDRTVRLNRPADFNCNGRARGTVSADVNADRSRDTLHVVKEWQILVLDPRFVVGLPFRGGSSVLRGEPSARGAGVLPTGALDESHLFDTLPLIYRDKKKPKLKVKRKRRGRKVAIKVKAKDKKHLDRLIVDLGKPVNKHIERDPKKRRRKLKIKKRVPKRTRVGAVALDQALNYREKLFRAK